MQLSYILFLLGGSPTLAYPWVANMHGVDSSLLKGGKAQHAKRAGGCPFNPDHPGAAPFNSEYPYTGAQNGLPGTQAGGIKVPADGDTAHEFEAAGPNDIRGPCPGLNTAANHHFLSHDGITTFEELVDAQQNLYNVGYDLAVLLATLGVGLDGDPITGKLSIGCDATERTSATGSLFGEELGLNGHNKFEGDTSLTRNDYFLANGDDFSFNQTLFNMMDDTCNSVFDRDGLSLYRFQRYQQSLAENENFYYGPKSLLLYGAASFLYELFPSLGPEGVPDLPTISSFFLDQKIPDDWLNRRTPYTIPDVSNEISAQYQAHPVLFGGNTAPGHFDTLSYGPISNGTFAAEPDNVLCLLYQFATENVPSSLSNVLELPLEVVEFATSKLNPIFKNFGCPLKTT